MASFSEEKNSPFITSVFILLFISSCVLFYFVVTHKLYRNTDFAIDPFHPAVKKISTSQDLYAIIDETKKLSNGKYKFDIIPLYGDYTYGGESQTDTQDKDKIYTIVVDPNSPEMHNQVTLWEYTTEQWVDPVDEDKILDYIYPGDVISFSTYREYNRDGKNWTNEYVIHTIENDSTENDEEVSKSNPYSNGEVAEYYRKVFGSNVFSCQNISK